MRLLDPPTPLPPALSDGRVALRRPASGDVETIAELARDPDIQDTHWLPIPYRCETGQARALVEECGAGWARPSTFGATFFATCLPDDEMVGVVHLSAQSAGVVQVAYWIAPGHRRRGLALAALRLLATWAHGHQLVLELRFGENNYASRRLAEAAGFRLLGHASSGGYVDRIYRSPRQEDSATRRDGAELAAG
jgi:RimJ/RimL family protein N-acetyltransferase